MHTHNSIDNLYGFLATYKSWDAPLSTGHLFLKLLFFCPPERGQQQFPRRRSWKSEQPMASASCAKWTAVELPSFPVSGRTRARMRPCRR